MHILWNCSEEENFKRYTLKKPKLIRLSVVIFLSGMAIVLWVAFLIGISPDIISRLGLAILLVLFIGMPIVNLSLIRVVHYARQNGKSVTYRGGLFNKNGYEILVEK